MTKYSKTQMYGEVLHQFQTRLTEALEQVKLYKNDKERKKHWKDKVDQ